MMMYHFVETAVENRTSERETCHFAPFGMTVFDGNQEIIPLIAFSTPKNVYVHKKGITFALEKIE